jgi:hypothetical protein
MWCMHHPSYTSTVGIGPHQLHSPHRSVDFFKINVLLLHILLCDESCFVPDDTAMLIFLGFVDDPLEADPKMSHNEIDDIPCCCFLNGP